MNYQKNVFYNIWHKYCRILKVFILLFPNYIFRYDKWLKGEDVGPHPEEPDRKVAAPLPLPQDILCNKNNASLPQSYMEGPFKKKRGRMMAGYPK